MASQAASVIEPGGLDDLVVALRSRGFTVLGPTRRDGAIVYVEAVPLPAAPPGTLHRLDAAEGELPAELFRTSTHHFGLAEAVELARAVGALPQRLVVFGIEAGQIELGDALTAEVEDAVGRAADAVRTEVLACANMR